MSGTGAESSGRGERLVASAVAEGGAGADNRFGISRESIGSIADGGQISGESIPLILQQYAPTVRVLGVASDKEFLARQLAEMLTDEVHATFILPMQVNIISGNYDAPGNHYTGLIIRRLPVSAMDGEAVFPPPRYSIQYIDPIGRPIDASVVEKAREVIERDGVSGVIEGEIDSYEGAIQQGVITGGKSEDHETSASASRAEATGFEVLEGNDVDCGPMFIYLAARAASGQNVHDLPGLDAGGVELSRNIGLGIRRAILADASIEKDGFMSFRETSLEVLAHSGAEGRRAMGTGGFEPSAERTSRNPAVGYRRLDSIARLITGNSICSAVAFDGENIIYANNKSTATDLSRRVFALLRDVASSGSRLSEMGARFGMRMEEIVNLTTKGYFSKKRREPSLKVSSEYKNRIISDMNKVICSLAVDGDREKRFAPEIISALLRGAIRFVPGTPGRMDVGGGRMLDSFTHAEMSLLDVAVTEDGFGGVPDRRVREGEKPFYLGISKLCCLDCHTAVIALNKDNVDLGSKSGVVEIVEVRGEHLAEFPWVRPEFFSRRPKVDAEYLRLKDRPGPRAQAEQLADLSDSEPELDILGPPAVIDPDRLFRSTAVVAASGSLSPDASPRGAAFGRRGAGRGGDMGGGRSRRGGGSG